MVTPWKVALFIVIAFFAGAGVEGCLTQVHLRDAGFDYDCLVRRAECQKELVRMQRSLEER